jgi:hypothetical protein
VTASAYAFAHAGGQPPEELILAGYLQHYGGAVNVLGRPLGIGEIRRMSTVENIVNWYREREAADNWAAWEKLNADKKQNLDHAYKLAVEMGMIKNGT